MPRRKKADIDDAQEIEKVMTSLNKTKVKLKKLELQQKKLDAKNKLSYEDDYYGDEFFEDEEDNNEFYEVENVISYNENCEDI